MDYELKNATKKDILRIKNYKKETIFAYAQNLTKEETDKINNYIDKTIKKEIVNYQLIIVENKIVGCLLVEKEKDGVLLNEIFLEENYRHKGIGTNIIKNIIKEYNTIFLWVYKENINAISLYKKLGFKIVEQTNSRFFMRLSKV